jgi:hypothetical protein
MGLQSAPLVTKMIVVRRRFASVFFVLTVRSYAAEEKTPARQHRLTDRQRSRF